MSESHKLAVRCCWQPFRCSCEVDRKQQSQHRAVKELKGYAKSIEIRACRWALVDSDEYEEYLPRLETLNGLRYHYASPDVLRKAIAVLFRWCKLDSINDEHAKDELLDTMDKQIFQIRNVLYGAFHQSIHCRPEFLQAPVRHLIYLSTLIKESECEDLWPMVAAYERMTQDSTVASSSLNRVHRSSDFYIDDYVNYNRILPKVVLDDYEKFKASNCFGHASRVQGNIQAEQTAVLLGSLNWPETMHCDLDGHTGCILESSARLYEKSYDQGREFLRRIAATIEHTACHWAILNAQRTGRASRDFDEGRPLSTMVRLGENTGIQTIVAVLRRWCKVVPTSSDCRETGSQDGDGIQPQIAEVKQVLYGCRNSRRVVYSKPIVPPLPTETCLMVARSIGGEDWKSMWPLIAAYERMQSDAAAPRLPPSAGDPHETSDGLIKRLAYEMAVLPFGSLKPEDIEAYQKFRGSHP